MQIIDLIKSISIVETVLFDKLFDRVDNIEFTANKQNSESFFHGRKRITIGLIKLKEPDFEYLFDTEFIRKYKEILNWERISLDAPLTEQNLDEFKDELLKQKCLQSYGYDKVLFSKNEKINWNSNILEKFADHLDWNAISNNPSIPWTPSLFKKYRNKLNGPVNINFWNSEMIEALIDPYNDPNNGMKFYVGYLDSLSLRKNIRWEIGHLIKYPSGRWVDEIKKNNTLNIDFDILKEYKNKMTASVFSLILNSGRLTWDIGEIQYFYDLINFNTLSACTNVKWSSVLFEKFRDEWNYTVLSKNNSFCWSLEIYYEYIDKWDFNSISTLSTFPWSLDFIEQNINLLHLNSLIQCSKIKFTGDFIHKHKDMIDWSNHNFYGSGAKYLYIAAKISECKNVEILPETLLEKCKEWETGGDVEIPWSERGGAPGEWHYFSSNKYLTEEHLDKFLNKLSWGVVSSNEYFNPTLKILKKFHNYWDWDIISKKVNIDWSCELLLELKDYVNWKLILENQLVWENVFRPNINLIKNYFLFAEYKS